MSKAMPDAQYRFRVELRELLQRGAVMEQARVEKIRRHAPRLGLEFAEAQHFLLDGEADELLAEIGRHRIPACARAAL